MAQFLLNRRSRGYGDGVLTWFSQMEIFFCHPLWKDPLIVRGVYCFHINGFFSILFLCFFRLSTGNKWLAGMGSGFDFFFAFMDTVFTLGFFLVRFSSYFLLNSA